MGEERDWRREAIYWRFMFGDGAQAISQAWDIGLEQVEHELRLALRVAPAFQPALVGGQAQLVTRIVHRRTRELPKAKSSKSEKPARTDWQAKALGVLANMSHAAPLGEILTKLRVPDEERKQASARLWAALQALVKRDDVVREGTRYRLAKETAA